jgi:hypothetical protein
MDNFNANPLVQKLIEIKNNGGTPQQAMQFLISMNPNINMAQTQLMNMSKGRTPQQFIMQLARQNGVSPENMQGIMSLFVKR